MLGPPPGGEVEGAAALVDAIIARDFTAVSALLSQAASASRLPSLLALRVDKASKQSLLHLALAPPGTCRRDIVFALTGSGIDVNARDRGGRSPLHLAVMGGLSDVAIHLAKECGARVDVCCKAGGGPAREAAVTLDQEELEQPAAAGGEVLDTQIQVHLHTTATTPLHIACSSGLATAASAMLRFAKVDLKDKAGATPVSVAAAAGRTELVTLLIREGASLSLEDAVGRYPLHYAAENGHAEVCSQLVERGASQTVRDQNGISPLHAACAAGRDACVLALLTAAADDGQVRKLQGMIDLSGRTSLFLAARHGAVGCVAILLEAAGLRVDTYSRKNSTPLSAAAKSGHADCCRLLLRAGADVNHEGGNNNITPLALAVEHGHLAVAEVLVEHNATLSMACIRSWCDCIHKGTSDAVTPDAATPDALTSGAVPEQGNAVHSAVGTCPSSLLLSLQDNMKQCFLSQSACDVSFKVGDQVIGAHRSIVTARCEALDAMLSSPMIEGQTLEVVVGGDVSMTAFRSFLLFLYAAERPKLASPQALVELLSLSSQYMLPQLHRVCEEELCAFVCCETAQELFDLSNLHDALFLKACSAKCVLCNMSLLVSQGQNELVSQVLHAIISSVHCHRY